MLRHKKGPVATAVVRKDWINKRGVQMTQSNLLECMQGQSVSVCAVDLCLAPDSAILQTDNARLEYSLSVNPFFSFQP